MLIGGSKEHETVSVNSDITTSLIAGKHQRGSKYRPGEVDTIDEDEEYDDGDYTLPTSVESTTLDGSKTIDNSMVDTLTAGSQESTLKGDNNDSLLMNIGCAIVDSLSEACSPPPNTGKLVFRFVFVSI